MKASNKKSTLAQGLGSLAFEQAAIVFAFTGFAVGAIGPEAKCLAAVREARALFWSACAPCAPSMQNGGCRHGPPPSRPYLRRKPPSQTG